MPASKRVIDFTNVKEQGDFNPKRKPAGDYRMVIKKVEDHTSKAGNEQWVFTIVPTTDQRATYPYYCGMDTEQAWKIRNLFLAAGIQAPKRKVRVDPNKLIGREIGASLDDDEYEGRLKSVVSQVFPTSDLDDDEPDEDDRPAKRRNSSKASTKKRRKQDDDDDDLDDDEDVDELDLEEL